MTAIRHRELGTMSLEKAQQAAQYLNEKFACERFQAKHRFAARWIVIEVFDVCDLRCVQAQGDQCECHCSGIHHAEGV